MVESPLVKKLGIKSGQTVLIMEAPEGYIQTLGTLPCRQPTALASGCSFDGPALQGPSHDGPGHWSAQTSLQPPPIFQPQK